MTQHRSIPLIATALVAVLLTGCAHMAPPAEAPFRAVYYRSSYAVDFDVAYGEHERHRMDLYLRGAWHAPGPKINVRMEGPQPPTIVFSYGSSWFFGDKRTWEHFISPFLQRGYNVINLNYRVKMGIPKAVQDVRQALIHLAEHNDRYALDLERVVLVGASAGAHMWTLLGAANNSGKEKFALPDSLGIAGVVNISGGGARCGAIYHLLNKHENPWWRGVAASLVEDLSQVDAIMDEHCPVKYLDEGDPPFFLTYGEKDPFITSALMDEIVGAMERHGISHEVASYPDSGHGFLGKDYDAMFQRIFAFLDRVVPHTW